MITVDQVICHHLTDGRTVFSEGAEGLPPQHLVAESYPADLSFPPESFDPAIYPVRPLDELPPEQADFLRSVVGTLVDPADQRTIKLLLGWTDGRGWALHIQPAPGRRGTRKLGSLVERLHLPGNSGRSLIPAPAEEHPSVEEMYSSYGEQFSEYVPDSKGTGLWIRYPVVISTDLYVAILDPAMRYRWPLIPYVWDVDAPCQEAFPDNDHLQFLMMGMMDHGLSPRVLMRPDRDDPLWPAELQGEDLAPHVEDPYWKTFSVPAVTRGGIAEGGLFLDVTPAQGGRLDGDALPEALGRALSRVTGGQARFAGPGHRPGSLRFVLPPLPGSPAYAGGHDGRR